MRRHLHTRKLTDSEDALADDEVLEEEYMPEDGEVLETEYIPIDYEMLETEGHRFLNKNICENPLPIKENAWLCQQIQPFLDEVEEYKKYDTFDYPMDYFMFDLNDDGLDDYIIPIDGYWWHGTLGHTVRIYRQTKDGLESLNYIIAEIHDCGGVTDYWPIAVLDEKTDGYYDIVLPWRTIWNEKAIWKYDREMDCYKAEQ